MLRIGYYGVNGVNAGPIWRALQEQVRSQPSLIFIYVVMQAVTWEQEDVDAIIVKSKVSQPMYFRVEVLALSPLSTLQTAIWELMKNMTSV